MRRFRWALRIALMVISCWLLLPTVVQAKHKKQPTNIPEESKATFMLMPELPKDNLGGQQLGYFNLKLKANQKRVVRIKVYNPTDHSLNIYGQVVDATTNDNATINYLGQNKINTTLLTSPGSNQVTVPHKQVLPSKATKWITIKIHAPRQGFTGIKATAINLSANQFNQTATIRNTYRYAIGLIFNGRQLSKKHYQYLKSPNIKTRFLANKKAAISIKTNNPDAIYLQNVKAQIALKNQKWGFITYNTTLKNGKIAPNSSFYINLLLGGKRLVPGVYNMTMEVKSRQYTKTIHKYVAVTKSQARYINRYNAAYLRNRNLIIGCVVVILGLIITFMGFRLRKRKRDSNAKNDQ